MSFEKHPLVPDYVYSPRTTDDEVPFFERAYLREDKFYGADMKANDDRFEYAKRLGYSRMEYLRARLGDVDTSFEFYGDKGFAWPVNHDLVSQDKNAFFVCAGAGGNITFEMALANLYKDKTVYLLDPSPHSIRHVENQTLPNNLLFEKVGLSDRTETLVFHKPSAEGIGSLSALALNPSDDTFELPVENLEDLCTRVGRDPADITYLKFDIEGSEHVVIDHMIERKIFPKQITLEYDQPVPPWTIESSLRSLICAGYELQAIWGLNVYLTYKG
ncbi:FkbM family methyltransferase [Erythrobacter sp.]